jgi:ribosomal protein S18 acetylase RimI-like enzyme
MLARAQKLADSERGLALVVAAYDEQAIAFGLLTYWPKIAELSDLIVAPDFRGLGIGAALIGALCEQAHRAGHSRAQIGVAEANHRALALYLRLGFEYERRLILKLEDEEEAVWYLLKSLG